MPETNVDPRDRREHLGEIVAGMLELTGLMNDAFDQVGATEVRSNADLIVLTTVMLDGPSRPRDMLDATNLTTGGMTNLLDRLEAAGLLERSGGVENDARGVLVTLTATGVELIDRVARTVRSTLATAGPLLERWWEYLDAMGLDVGPLPSPTGPLRRELERIRRVAEVGRRFFQIYEPSLGGDDPTPHHTFHLLWLASKPGGVRPRAISAATRLSSPATSELIARVEQRGLVRRLASESDRRAVVVTITGTGRDTLDDLLDAVQPLRQRLADAYFPN